MRTLYLLTADTKGLVIGDPGNSGPDNAVVAIGLSDSRADESVMAYLNAENCDAIRRWLDETFPRR